MSTLFYVHYHLLLCISSVVFFLFPSCISHLVFPCISALDEKYIEFVGMLVGKALFEQILVELPFASFFLKKLRGLPASISDLKSLDSQLYTNLLGLKNYQGNVEDLGLTFAVTANSTFVIFFSTRILAFFSRSFVHMFFGVSVVFSQCM